MGDIPCNEQGLRCGQSQLKSLFRLFDGFQDFGDLFFHVDIDWNGEAQ